MPAITQSQRNVTRWLKFTNGAIITGTILFCLLMLYARIPGMMLLGISPHWTIIWLVAWSVNRKVKQAAIAGLCLGLIHDSLTVGGFPTHVIGLVTVGVMTSRLQKDKYIREDFISIALIVFLMVLIHETTMMAQYSLRNLDNLSYLWLYHGAIALASAVLSSLWAPVLYFPLNLWWDYLRKKQKQMYGDSTLS
jgi:rod shape-determining protein MreD